MLINLLIGIGVIIGIIFIIFVPVLIYSCCVISSRFNDEDMMLFDSEDENIDEHIEIKHIKK